MKRNILKVAFAAIAIIAIVSCEDRIVVPEVIPAQPVDKAGIVFTATTETAAATKTALSQNGAAYDVLWQNGDEITIVDGAANVGVYSTTSTTTSGTFSHKSGDVVATPNYTAYYPASMYSGGTLTLPDIQVYTPGNITEAPMYATSSTSNLEFKNLCGILRLNITTSMSSQKVRSIGLYANQYLCGPFSVESDAAVITSSQAIDRYLSLNCGEEGVDISSTPTSFYFAIPPGDYTNLQISLFTTEGLTQIKILKSDKTVTIERSTITDINLSYDDLAVVNLASPSPWSSNPNNYWIGPLGYVKLTGNNSNYIFHVGRNSTVILDNASFRSLWSSGDMTVILHGTNSLYWENNRPFYVGTDTPGNITIDGDGSLSSTVGSSSNICLGDYGTQDVIIKGGTITLRQKYDCTSKAMQAQNLIVQGGTLNAEAGWGTYSIGVCLDIANDILISGGTVNAYGMNALRAGRNIEISGGNVTARGHRQNTADDHTGITARGNISISGGTVEAIGGYGSPGIGIRSWAASCGNISITGGTVTALGGTEGDFVAAGIGTGSYASATCGDITIGPDITYVTARKGASTNAVAPIGKGVSTSTVGTVSIDPSLTTNVSTVNVTDDTWTITPAGQSGQYYANASNIVAMVAAFNASEQENPTLTLTQNTDASITITRADGTIDFNGCTVSGNMFLQNDVAGKYVTLRNGTLSASLDGNGDWYDWYNGTVILENMTITGSIFTDGHAFVFVSGHYNGNINNYTVDGKPGTVVIQGGYFRGNYDPNGDHGYRNNCYKGQYTLYGGKYKNSPTNTNQSCASGYSVKSNTDEDSGTYPYIVSEL